jgi:hypothetical protein
MKTITIGGETIEITDKNRAEYEAFVAASQKRDAWPQISDEYWLIDSNGRLVREKWDAFETDQRRESIGNIYRTEAEALAVVEKRKAQARIDAVIRENGLEFVPDWEARDKYRYWTACRDDGRIESMSCNLLVLAPFYAATKADANAIIAACEADLKIVLGVK